MSPQNRVFAAARGIFFAGDFITLWSWLAARARRYDERIGVAPPGWLRLPGWALAAAGATLAASGVAVFATRGRGTPAPFDPPRQFVADGPYRRVRNPMYVGAFGVMTGMGLATGSISILLLSAVFALLAHAFVVLYEEPDLERRFGDSYRRYLRTVGRWIPRRQGKTPEPPLRSND